MLYETLNRLYALHILCTECEHGIRRGSQAWEAFEPSLFIHTYFTFSSIYSYDWERSFADTSPSAPFEWCALDRGTRELDDIYCLVFFCYTSLRQVSAQYTHYLRKYVADVHIDDLEAELQDITNDPELLPFKQAAVRGLEVLYAGESLPEKKHMPVMMGLLGLIYAARNSIFLGKKTISTMIAPKQRQQLRVFTAILQATNALLFDAAHARSHWSPLRE